MSGCPHEYHEREASVYVDGLCPLCQRAEIERLQERLKGSDMLAHVRGEQIERLRAALRELLSGHDNLYRAHWGHLPTCDPRDDIAAKAARRALEGK